ncbi:MAG: TolC family protein, partial [Myxococcota bacterium]
GGLTADDAAARAILTAPSMARAETAVAIAEAGARRTWQALFPRLDLSFRYTRLSDVDLPPLGGGLITPEQEAVFRTGIDGVQDPAARGLWNGLVDGLANDQAFSFPVILNNYAFRASVTYPVSDLFFTILPAYRAQESGIEAQEAQLDVERAQVALRAREAFYEVIRARANASVAQKSLEQAEANRDRVAALVEGGALARVELLRLQAQVAQARVGISQADSGVQVAEHALRVLLHIERSEPVRIGEDLRAVPPPFEDDVNEVVERALEQRVEVQALERAVTAQERAIRAELGRRYPQLALQANLDYANPNNRIIPQREEFDATWDLSIVLSWSPNDFGSARQRVIEAQAQVTQLETDMDALRDGVRIEVEQAVAQYEAARAGLEAAEAGLVAAEETRRVRVAQLDAGAAVTADLVDAETDLTRARLSMVNTTIDLHLLRARLVRAAALDVVPAPSE